MNENDILGQFPEDPLPASRVDVAAAVRSGRRRRRAYAAAGSGGAVLAVLAAVLVVPGAIGYARGGGAGGTGVGAEPKPTVAVSVSATPSRSTDNVSCMTVPITTKLPDRFSVLERFVGLPDAAEQRLMESRPVPPGRRSSTPRRRATPCR
ncbi:hypothetical protein ACFQX7_28440 [Luedemannella flava]